MIYGLLKTGSTHISEIARVLEPDNKLIHIEKRFTDNLSKLSLKSIHDSLIEFSLNNLCKKPLVIDVDESDIVKPHGHKFEKLGIIHDGSKGSRPKKSVQCYRNSIDRIRKYCSATFDKKRSTQEIVDKQWQNGLML